MIVIRIVGIVIMLYCITLFVSHSYLACEVAIGFYKRRKNSRGVIFSNAMLYFILIWYPCIKFMDWRPLRHLLNKGNWRDFLLQNTLYVVYFLVLLTLSILCLRL